MVILDCKLENFGSYKTLDFKFNDKGLTLIHGPTGSGKSTLCDAVPWVLFGRTSKNGAVDDVLNWSTSIPTSGIAQVDCNGVIYEITRIRGNKANDLHYKIAGYNTEVTRGKDLADTQKLINSILGVDLETYLAAAYYHEFSSTAGFFTSTAKQRRGILEQLVDLSLAINLQSKLSESKKTIKQTIAKLQEDLRVNDNQHRFLIKKQKETEADFEKQKASELQVLNIKLDQDTKIASTLPGLRLKLEDLKAVDVCKECGNTKNNKEYLRLSSVILAAQQADLQAKQTSENITKLISKKPPTSVLSEIKGLLKSNKIMTTELNKLNESMSDIEVLLESTDMYRSTTISDTINHIEEKTNEYLTNFFDAEISVEFSADLADKIDIVIRKDGNECSISQLSKGQRTLLKLCFGVSVMQAVSNHRGVKFDQIFFDEALDGLDDDLKLKSLNMLWTLNLDYNSIYLVEHSNTIKAQIDTKYEVKLVNGFSVI